MSNPNLPAELLDHIIDYLHDTEDALMNCCLVSKSWIPRTRKHLFADVWFFAEEFLELWKETFPDPSTSPARYAKTLTINCPHAVMAADAEVGGWIRGFSHIVSLEVGGQGMQDNNSDVFLIPLQGLSRVVKSLNIDHIPIRSSRILDFILSFPLLEDLAVTNCNDAAINGDDGSNGPPTIIQPSNPPTFTGSLTLMRIELAPIARRLLSLQGGIHFRKFTLKWDHGEDNSLITALVEGCSHTLESIDIGCNPLGAPPRHLRLY